MDSEYYFDIRKAKIFRAIRWGGLPVFKSAVVLKKIFFYLFVISLLIFSYGFLGQQFSKPSLSQLMGFLLISFSSFLLFWYLAFFFDSKIKKPRLSFSHNLAEYLDFEVAQAALRAQGNLTRLFYYLLAKNPKLDFIFSRILMKRINILKMLKRYMKIAPGFRGRQPGFEAAILHSLRIARKRGNERIGIFDIMPALARNEHIFQKILIDAGLNADDIEILCSWLEKSEKRIARGKRFWDFENLIKKGSIGKEWATGYTVTLDRFSVDLTKMIKERNFPEIIGHKEEIKEAERVLAQRESNNSLLLVGEAGTGRKSIIYALAEKSTLGKSFARVNYKRFVQLDLSSLLAQFENIEELEKMLDKIFQEVIYAKNVILVIDKFHDFVGLPGFPQPGRIDISGVISPYLESPEFQIVAITTFRGLHKNIEQNPSILSFLEKIEVSEASKEETLEILEDAVLELESKYKIFISYQAIKEIISLCDRYFTSMAFPKKATDLLEEAVVFSLQKKEKLLTPDDVSTVVSQKTQVPVGQIKRKERRILLNLEKLIHQRIINQNEAVNEVSDALRRGRARVGVRNGPMGTFLFLGPTGVGKTETSKALAEIYFGSEKVMIRLDMSEFQNIGDIKRLLGSPGEEGLLTTPVRENPFSLVLLDEFEKAHPKILNLFLQVFDEGHLTDGEGRKVDFRNTIIIATSNAGANIIWERVRENKELGTIKDELLDQLIKKRIFTPELVNRFDGVIIFKPLTKDNLLKISGLLLGKIKKQLAEKEIDFSISQSLKERIVSLSYDPKFGARKMQRVIEERVGNPIARGLLGGRLKKGDIVEVEPENFQLKIKPR